MKFSEQAKAAGIQVSDLTTALTELAGSALAVRISIEGEVDYQALVPEVTQMRNLLGVVSSAFSVLFLTSVTATGGAIGESGQKPA